MFISTKVFQHNIDFMILDLKLHKRRYIEADPSFFRPMIVWQAYSIVHVVEISLTMILWWFMASTYGWHQKKKKKKSPCLFSWNNGHLPLWFPFMIALTPIKSCTQFDSMCHICIHVNLDHSFLPLLVSKSLVDTQLAQVENMWCWRQ